MKYAYDTLHTWGCSLHPQGRGWHLLTTGMEWSLEYNILCIYYYHSEENIEKKKKNPLE